MSHLWKERQDLDKADADIAAGEKRVTEQITLIERLAAEGQDTTEARKLLRNYETTLEAWRDHRRLILEEIERLEGPALDGPEH
jgi:hypothetical protein